LKLISFHGIEVVIVDTESVCLYCRWFERSLHSFLVKRLWFGTKL